MGLFEKLDGDGDGVVRLQEWTEYCESIYKEKGPGPGAKALNVLFTSINRRYADWLEEQLQDAILKGDFEMVRKLKAQSAEEKEELRQEKLMAEKMTHEKNFLNLMTRADDVFDKISAMSGGVFDGTLSKDELVTAHGGDFGEYL